MPKRTIDRIWMLVMLALGVGLLMGDVICYASHFGMAAFGVACLGLPTGFALMFGVKWASRGEK